MFAGSPSFSDVRVFVSSMPVGWLSFSEVMIFVSFTSEIAVTSTTSSAALTALMAINETNIIEINNRCLLIFRIILPPIILIKNS